jgi:hypothetical protein
MHVLLKNVFLLLSVFRQCKLNTHLLFLQKTKKEDDDESGADRLTAVDQNAGTVWCRSTYSGRSSVYKFPVLKKKTRGNKAYAAAVLDMYAEKFTLHFDPTKKNHFRSGTSYRPRPLRKCNNGRSYRADIPGVYTYGQHV